ncbi:ComF family protein [Bifidobacterium platyrrhinorum]|nr:phosphoribosyltransferase family protein [Bifidobacterium platyrrhinorum]
MGAAYACAVYEGAVRRAVLGWKDHGDEECDRAFATALCTLAERVDVLRRLGASGKDGVLVVPAPSSARSTRRRGRRHLMPSARALAAWCGRSGIDARVRRVLANAVDGGKAVETVGARGRAARLGGRIRVRGSAGLAGSRVILVDDIITTGATMRSCVAALDAAGAARVVCLALAATPRYGVSAM